PWAWGNASRLDALCEFCESSALRRPLDLDPPGRRELHAPFPEGYLRVRDVLFRRRDREDFHARLNPRRRADRGAEGGPHSFGDSVCARTRRDLVLPEDIVRVQPQLQVIRVPRLLHDVAVRGDAGRFEGDVTDLALLLRDQVNLDGEIRLQVPDVELADPDARDAAHVSLLGIRLPADLSIHAPRFARHGRRALEGAGAI